MDEYNEVCVKCHGSTLSACCGAEIILHDICSYCGEHCDNQCEECPENED